MACWSRWCARASVRAMDEPDLEALHEKLVAAVVGLADVNEKKMFGCQALFAGANIFALVWKLGRLGLRLPDDKKFEELMSFEGAEPWKAGPMTMSHWVLVPPKFHDDPKALAAWVKRAHALAAEGKADAKPKVTKTKKKK